MSGIVTLWFSSQVSPDQGAVERFWPLTRSPFAKLFPGGNLHGHTLSSWIMQLFQYHESLFDLADNLKIWLFSENIVPPCRRERDLF